MSSDTRHSGTGTSTGNARSKRRVTEAGDDDNNTVNTGGSNNRDDPGSNPKRQRVSRACDSCRSKKDKCDGAQPVCSTCASLSRPCTYRANPKKRGLPTGYIRTLEMMWGLVFTKIQGSEEVVRALLKATNIPGHLATVGKEAEGSDALMSSWKNSVVLKDIERLLTVLEQPEEEGRSVVMESPADSILSPEALEWQLPGPGSTGELREEVSGLGALGPSPVRAPFRPAARVTKDSATQTMDDTLGEANGSRPGSTNISAPEPCKLPPNPWPLFDIYFSYTQCWFPILEKHDILRTAFRHADDDSHDSASGDEAALWAVLAFASIQQASISVTRQLDVSDEPNPKQLYARARSLIPSEGDSQIGHVQALLVLSLIKLGQQNWAAAWMLIGQAVRMAQSLGLNSSTNTLNDKTAGRSKHVFLGCFVLETLVAAQIGQVPPLRKSDLNMVGLINEDGLEEWHPWEDQTGLRPVEPSRSFHRGPLHALSTFNRLVSLMAILNDLCFSPSDNPTYLEGLERQLQIWVSALPKSYRIDLQTVSSKPASPHIFGLEMMYEGVSAFLSVQLAAQKNERNGLRRASEGSKRLISLLQTYMDTYSLSATCPYFGLALTLGLPSTGVKRALPWVEVDPGIKHKLGSFSAHLATVWNYNGRQESTRQSIKSPAVVAQSVPGRVSHLIDEARPVSLATPDTYLSPGWMGTSLNADAVLSLPTPASSLNIGPAIDPGPPVHRSSVSGRPSAPISDITTPFPAGQYPYNDTGPNYQSLVDMDGPLQRPRIAPDLDALFDELASLDGTDRVDNQPEFMQNLGFVPEAGIPDLYPYTSQRDPFLLAPTQQIQPESNLRRESQVSDLNPR